MKTTVALSAILACTFALSACAGRQAKEQPAFGDPQVSQGETEVQTEERVVDVRTKRTEIPTIRTTQQRADLNRLETEQFIALGLPEELANSVVEYRDDHGDFASVDQLRQVPGMTDDLFNRVKDRVGVAPA